MRWFNLVPIESTLPVRCCVPHLSRLRSLSRGVKSRTGCSAWYDTLRGEICFGYENGGDPAIVLGLKAFKDPGRTTPDSFDGASSKVGEDDIVRTIQLAKVSAWQKERWGKSRAAMKKNDDEQSKASLLADLRPDVTDRLKFNKKKVQMGKHFKGIA